MIRSYKSFFSRSRICEKADEEPAPPDCEVLFEVFMLLDWFKVWKPLQFNVFDRLIEFPPQMNCRRQLFIFGLVHGLSMYRKGTPLKQNTNPHIVKHCSAMAHLQYVGPNIAVVKPHTTYPDITPSGTPTCIKPTHKVFYPTGANSLTHTPLYMINGAWVMPTSIRATASCNQWVESHIHAQKTVLQMSDTRRNCFWLYCCKMNPEGAAASVIPKYGTHPIIPVFIGVRLNSLCSISKHTGTAPPS